MSDFLQELTDQLNLRWAWDKVRREAAPGDIWFDEIELAAFELDLERNLAGIAKDLKGNYRIKPLRPMPFPKHADKHGTPRVRQVFQVSVRDQVAWTALVNVIGPHVDSKMPTWSYGNRLFRTIWVQEDKDGVKRRKIGRYRHARGRLYLPFGQSWPVFRRHVYLATQAMISSDNPRGMDERTEEELSLQTRLSAEHRCPFVVPEYWKYRGPKQQARELFWCSVDLEKFYPTLKLKVVQQNIVAQLPQEWRLDAAKLLRSMLRFRLDLASWTTADLQAMDLRADRKTFSNIPTGLYVAGFLANAGMLKVDAEVDTLLAKRNVAHFRFVDDHIILAYSLAELTDWVRDYTKLLDSAGTGTRINPDKVEPEELAPLLTTRSKRTQKTTSLHDAAKKACSLDPEFPSPLMTKTLAVVSAIARTDFNLLDSGELAALSDQLEHLLLVDLPEEEMPEKTRLSFAATRLTRIAECRLANNEPLIELGCRKEVLDSQLAQTEIKEGRREQLTKELEKVVKDLASERGRLDREVAGAFQLLRKVLRERPDRVRLWTRAVLMCRLTGVKGLPDLLGDIEKYREKNPLAGEFLRANLLVLVGTQSVLAARILRNEDAANWRKQAARAFLQTALATKIDAPQGAKSRWYLQLSWHQYLFGLHCAGILLKDEALPGHKSSADRPLADGLFDLGSKALRDNVSGHSRAQWAWWASRMTLGDLSPRADRLATVLGGTLPPSDEATAFWRFFPLDVPVPILESMLLQDRLPVDSKTTAGWWFDALRSKATMSKGLPAHERPVVRRVRRMLTLDAKDSISLYEWCDHLQRLSHGNSSDPRNGEWTALEMVRQIGILMDDKQSGGWSYLRKPPGRKRQPICVHPANFRIPKAWLTPPEPTWPDWKTTIRQKRQHGRIAMLREGRLIDYRYTPLNAGNTLFRSVNPVRGLGLLLYGLLKKNFELPSLWNGPGHADVLGMLPKLLLAEMTCSSWTLGVLQGCLQPRSTETLFLKAIFQLKGHFDDDTLHDPIVFSETKEVVSAIEKCQHILERCQLSTLEHRARQLTPVDIRQLTLPEWSKDLAIAKSAGGADGA